ncbi:MAG: hypothetical protein VB137_08525 [Burkholderia sp.]
MVASVDLKAPIMKQKNQHGETVGPSCLHMKNIDPSFSGYYFAWSSCCLEHLGIWKPGSISS